jgi:hypothetical protein
MIYIVEMALKPGHTEADFQRWAVEMKPSSLLMTVQGILSVQRFQGVTNPLAYYAHYDIASADVLTSDSYKNVGGGVRVKNWSGDNIAYWHRDIADGVAQLPRVPEGYVLLMKKSDDADFSDEGFPMIRLKVVALNLSVPYRGLAVVPADAARKLGKDSKIQVYKPYEALYRKDAAGVSRAIS